MKKTILAALAFGWAMGLFAGTVDISVDLKFDNIDYVVGERIRAVVDVANSSPDNVSVGYPSSKDAFFIEVFNSGSITQLDRIGNRPFVSRFSLDSNEGQKLETFLGDHYDLRNASRYLAKPVLVHGGVRYEGAVRAFDVVEGVKIAGAMQMFSKRRSLQREFSLCYWSRNHSEHIFLTAHDSGSSSKRWETRDLGAMLRLDKPSLSILQTGEVIVLHRLNQDQFVRSEFWSLPDALEFRGREAVLDPATAGTARVRELYKSEGVKPKSNPWWKFW